MPTLKIDTDGKPEVIYKSTLDAVEEAMFAAHKEAADELKTEVRNHIGAKGFSTRWQNAYRVDLFPKSGKSLSPAIYAYHNIHYSNIFETGGTISGSPLWIPLPQTPKKLGRARTTPKKLAARGVDLFVIRSNNGASYLAANVALTKGEAKNNRPVRNVTLAKLRKGSQGSGPRRAVPLFVAETSVTIADRFQVEEIAEKQADKIASRFVSLFGAG